MPGFSGTRVAAHAAASVALATCIHSTTLFAADDPIPSPAPEAPPVAEALVLRLEADSGVQVDAQGAITAWQDLSGKGNDVYSGGDPRVSAEQTPAGTPAIDLDGNDFLERLHATHPLTGFPVGNEDRSMFVVVRYRGSNWWSGTAYGSGDRNHTFGLTMRHPSGELVLQGWGHRNDLVSTEPGLGEGWLLQGGVLTTGEAVLYRDGREIARQEHVYETLLNRLVIGEEIVGMGFVQMDVAAVLLYDRALDEKERLAVETYLNNKYLAERVLAVAIAEPADLARFPAEESILLAATVDSSDPSTPEVVWTSDVDGQLVPGPDGLVSGLSVGTHVLTATVSDQTGNTARESVTIEVVDDGPPVVEIIAPASESVASSEEVVALEATALDALDGELTAQVVWQSNIDGSLGTGGAVLANLSEGDHVIRAEAVDSRGLVGTAEVLLRIVSAEPTIAIATPADGARPLWGAEVALEAAASDGVGGDLGSGIVWFSDREGELGVGASLVYVPSVPGTHRITAQVVNSGGRSATETIEIVVGVGEAIVPNAPIPLFDGRSLGGLYIWLDDYGFADPDGIVSVDSGAIHIRPTGESRGSLITQGSFRDYILVFEFRWGDETFGHRFGKAKDAGLVFHSQGEAGGWARRLMPGIQSQMVEGGMGDIMLMKDPDAPMRFTTPVEQRECVNRTWNCRGGFLWVPGAEKRTFFEDVDARDGFGHIHWWGWDPAWEDVEGFRGPIDFESPDQDWNQMVVVAAGDTIEVYFNGQLVNVGEDVFPTEGKIQLQLEQAEYYVRRLELLPLGTPVNPIITNRELPAGVVGADYQATVDVRGIEKIVTIEIADGALPEGLSLDAESGLISGVPQAEGLWSFVVQAADEVGSVATAAFSIEVAPPPSEIPLEGLVLRLETDQGLVVDEAGNVLAWLDQSGMGNDLMPGGDPMVAAGALPSGLDAIALDGDDFLDRVHAVAPLSGLPEGNANRTMFMVARYNGSDWWSGAAYGNGDHNQAFGLTMRHPDGVLVLQGFGRGHDLVSSEPGLGVGWLVQSGMLEDSRSTLFRNGEPIAAFNHVYDTRLNRLVIGEEIKGLGFVSMDVAALLIYDRALSEAERLAVEAYLQTRYLATP